MSSAILTNLINTLNVQVAANLNQQQNTNIQIISLQDKLVQLNADIIALNNIITLLSG